MLIWLIFLTAEMNLWSQTLMEAILSFKVKCSLHCKQNQPLESVHEPAAKSLFRIRNKVLDYMYSSVIGLWNKNFGAGS